MVWANRNSLRLTLRKIQLCIYCYRTQENIYLKAAVNYLEHLRRVGFSVNESGGCVILLWMEKAPPIVTSPSLDSTGNSGLPCI